MEEIKKYWGILLAVVLVLVGGTYFFINQQKTNKKELKIETTSNNVETSKNNEKTESQLPSSKLTLKDGTVIDVGSEIEMVRPSYYEGEGYLSGKVSKVYEETGEMKIKARMGVAVINYRYVVEMDAVDYYSVYGEASEKEAYNHKVRGVVTLDEDGKEFIHFVKSIDPNFDDMIVNEITDMTSYDNRTYYDVFGNEKNVRKDIKDFYDKS